MLTSYLTHIYNLITIAAEKMSLLILINLKHTNANQNVFLQQTPI